MPTPEALAREKIDEQLMASGWIIQDYKALNLSAGKGIALREVPLKTGPCDYLLLVDRRPVGVIEAKKTGTTLSGVSEQSANYAENLPDFLAKLMPAGVSGLPFLYESTGVETLFRDERDPEPRSRRVYTFHRPDTFADRLAEPDTLRGRLAAMPTAHPLPAQNLRGLPGRGHHAPGGVLHCRPPPCPNPDGHRRGQDLHRLQFHLPAHKARRGQARPLPR